MKSLGMHYLLDFYLCEPAVLNNREQLRELMLEAARRGGATIVKDVFHQFSPHGITGVVVISESHLAIHTWPEQSYAAVDLFTCSETVDVEKIEAFLKSAFGCQRLERMELHRGERRKPAPFPTALA